MNAIVIDVNPEGEFSVVGVLISGIELNGGAKEDPIGIKGSECEGEGLIVAVWIWREIELSGIEREELNGPVLEGFSGKRN